MSRRGRRPAVRETDDDVFEANVKGVTYQFKLGSNGRLHPKGGRDFGDAEDRGFAKEVIAAEVLG